jgi:hypothetical protein
MALDAAAAAPVEHLDYASTMEIGDHGRKLAAGTMVRRVERQPLRRPGRASGPQLVVAVAEGTRDLIAAGLLLARDLGVRGAAADAFRLPPVAAHGDALADGNSGWAR